MKVAIRYQLAPTQGGATTIRPSVLGVIVDGE